MTNVDKITGALAIGKHAKVNSKEVHDEEQYVIILGIKDGKFVGMRGDGATKNVSPAVINMLDIVGYVTAREVESIIENI